ncbi:nucleoside-diphosphate sugar epimerase/dehydratase [Aquamicrobium sp. LC103]|uniref:nucleoside-diphosphate sugar epimerase/dehydratase n=1 Tax=Aquamicrobium sp. LC103 TaxID=1120658 RepID=UPI00063E805F|nr:nucleoside-diphosphate sugar epimerase/dehydratase [Aquamicrobium sp. LC103]TKT81179.1 polysaccharide biosynthesis protein [Aquamicrobium sp. LC103]
MKAFSIARRLEGGIPRYGKQFLLIAFDTMALLAAVWISYSLRFDRLFEPSRGQMLVMLTLPVIAIPIFIRMGLYRAVIRYLPERAIWTIFQAVTIATLVWVAVAFLTRMTGSSGVPRSIPVVFWVLAILIITGSRFGAKWLLMRRFRRPRKSTTQALIYGTDEAALQLAHALRASDYHYVAGFVSDDPGLQGMELLGARVFDAGDLERLVKDFGVDEVIVTGSTASDAKRRELIAKLSSTAARFRILPSIADLAAGKYLVSLVRDIDIDDLLGRSPVPADTALLHAMVKDNTILVTGAAGSIGSELCRTIVGLSPAKLVLLDFDERGLYEIHRELKKNCNVKIVAALGSITDSKFVNRVLEEHQVRTVYHCAAYKHVPLVEENALEGVRNNVLGTWVLVEAAVQHGVDNFIMISSDKAVRPTSVMGATKRWSELIVRYYGLLAADAPASCNFASVRFGNVLGSSGSVVPLFKEQIANGGPVTVTHPDMKRYFMSIREATELIIQAGGLSETGDILLLEMGEPVNIRDLAEDMVLLAGLSVRDGLNPDGDIEIVTIGTRDGEKLFEELFYDPDGVAKTSHPKILRGKRQNGKGNGVPQALEKLTALLDAQDEAAVRAFLFEYIRQH